MMVFLITLILLFYGKSYSESGKVNKKYFQSITKSISLSEDENVMFVFIDIRDCVGCDASKMVVFDCLARIDEMGLRLKMVAVVKCRRDKELKLFKHKFNWKYFAIRDKGNTRDELGVVSKTFVTILDSDGNIIYKLLSGSKSLADRNSCKEIISVLK